jgi:hypothetical protein
MHTERISIPDYDTDDRDAVYSTYMAVTNMSAGALDDFQNTTCYEDYRRTQSEEGDAAEACRVNKRLQSRSKSEWTDTDFENAVDAISFIARASEQSSEQTVSADCDLSPNDCRLIVWSHDPTGRYSTRELKMAVSDVVTVRALSNPRAPEYSGTTPTADRDWPEGGPSLTDYIEGYGTDAEREDGSDVSDLSMDTRSAIAGSTMLGEAQADTFDELVTFPVVFPDTGALSEDALDSVLSTIGLSNASDETADQLRNKARSLLESAFDREFSDEDKEGSTVRSAVGDSRGDKGADGDDSDTVDATESMNTDRDITSTDGADRDSGPIERASMDDLTQDTWVMWDSSGGMAYGKVVDTIEDGQYDEEIDGDQVITAPAALIEVYKLADGSWEGSETMVAHKPGSLIIKPKDEWPNSKARVAHPSPSSTERADHDDLSVDDRVRWGSRGGTVYGRVRELYDEGESVPDSAYTGSAGRSEGPAAIVALYDIDDDGNWFPQDGDQEGEKRTSHDPATLTKIDSFPESKAAALHEAGYQHREKSVQFRAADPNRQVVYGAVLLPNTLDAHGDFFREETVRSLSEGFMASMADADAEPMGSIPGLESAGAGGVMHATFEPSHLTLVENTILTESREVGTGPAARQFPEGTWLQGWRIEDSELWSLVHDSGVLSGYSIGMWVSETETYAPGELPDDVRVPDAIREQFADLDVDVEDMETGEVKSGDCHEVSLVDRPAVPDAVHVAHKTASDTGWQTDAEAFEQSRDDQPSYALAKAAGALTQSYDSCVAYLRDRGHSEDAADELASYLQRVSGFDTEAGEPAESAWTRIKSVFGDPGPGSDSLDADDTSDTTEIPVPLSVGTDTASAHAAPVTAEIPGESDSTEKVGRTLSERNERSAMALHDLSLLLLRDADRDGGRMLFAEDPEYSYDTDLTDVLSGDSDPGSESNSNSTSTDETKQLMDEIFESPSGSTSGSGGTSGSGESTSVAD